MCSRHRSKGWSMASIWQEDIQKFTLGHLPNLVIGPEYFATCAASGASSSDEPWKFFECHGDCAILFLIRSRNEPKNLSQSRLPQTGTHQPRRPAKKMLLARCRRVPARIDPMLRGRRATVSGVGEKLQLNWQRALDRGSTLINPLCCPAGKERISRYRLKGQETLPNK